MSYIIVKYLATAALVVMISELAKTNYKLGALITALPIVVILTLIWMHLEQQPSSKIASYAWYTFWFVLPTLPMFLIFPVLLPQWGFWFTLAGCIVFTAALFYFYALLMKRFGILLL